MEEIKQRLTKIEGDFLELRLDLMVYLRELQLKIDEAIIEFRQQPQTRQPPDTGQLMNAEQRTAQLIEKHFNLDELDELIFDFDTRPERIRGKTLDVKARELCAYLNRRGQLSELVKRCVELRPKAYGWPIEIIERY